MKLNRQQDFTHSQLITMFGQVYLKRLQRSGLKSSLFPTQWELYGYIDGPLTFVTCRAPNGVNYTGWAKFNANDNNYDERGGLYRALQRAVDKYIHMLSLTHTWDYSGFNLKDRNEPQDSEVSEEETNEAVSNEGSSSTNQAT